MKNISFALLLIILLIRFSQAQITLEASYSVSQSTFNAVRFGLAGDKYVYVKEAQKVIEIYDLNHVFEKSITIPSNITDNYWGIKYISDNLFDNDSSVEYLLTNTDDAFLGVHLYILKEDGSILFDRDSIDKYVSDDPFYVSEFGLVIPTVEGTKLVFRQANSGWEVYSLTGELPCYECSNGVFTGNFSPNNENKNVGSLSNPIPNPASNVTRIDYQFPDGIRKGDLIFYNSIGDEVKRFNVTNTCGFIYLSANNLPSGTYYYVLQTSSGEIGGKKMVVVK